MFKRNWLFWSGTVEGSGGEAAPPAPAPATTEAPAEAPAASPGEISQSVIDIMRFDPFAPEAETPASPPVSPAPEPVVEASPSPPPAPVDPLAQTVEQLNTTIQQLPDAIRQAAPPPAQQQPQQQVDVWAPQVDGQPLNYAQVMAQIPPQVTAGLTSENPVERQQALSQTLGMAMHIAHRLAFKQTTEQLRKEFSTILPQFVGEQLRVHTQMQTVFNDFYGKYPQLSHPSLRQIVQKEAMTLAQQQGINAWTDKFRDQLAEHVMSMLRGVVPPMVQPSMPATPSVGTTARPAMPAGPRSQQDMMAELLFG